MESTAGTSLQRNTSHHESKRLKREIDNDPHSKHRKKRAPQSISSTLHQAKVCDHFLPSAADRTCANCIPRATQSILRKVAISGYLSIQDLGRFLLCTSKNIVHDVYSNGDIAYQLLDRQVGYRRNSSPHDTPSMLCPLRLLHCLSKEEATRPDIPLRPLEFTPADYHVIINIFSMNQASGGKAIATKSIAGSSIPTFFDDGTFTEKIESFEIDIGIDYEISMHLLRSDGKCCCLIDCEAENWFGGVMCFHAGPLETNDKVYERMLYSDVVERFDCGVIEGTLMNLDIIDDHEIFVYPELSAGEEWIEWCEVGSKVKFAHLLEDLYDWDH